MGRIKRGLLLLLFLLVGTPAVGYGMQLSESELYARSACLMDADSGRVLYSKNSEQKLPMASTTKVMTCILALEDGRMDDLVTVSAYAASQPKVHMGAKAGEQFYLQDLLYALMLNSDNDAAVMIAEQVGGSVEGFTEKMNLKARKSAVKILILSRRTVWMRRMKMGSTVPRRRIWQGFCDIVLWSLRRKKIFWQSRGCRPIHSGTTARHRSISAQITMRFWE